MILEYLYQGFLISFGWMSILWIIGTYTKNYAIVDFGWAISLLLYTTFYFMKSDGLTSKELLVLLVVLMWSLRLSHYLFYERIWKHKEEGRYQKLRDVFKTHVSLKFFLFFQAQALLNALLSLPFLFIAMDADLPVTPLDLIAFSISFFAIFLETLADEQLKEFKSNPENKGKVCDVKLWGYSRHPNYFFESCIWFGFFLLGVTHSNGVFGIAAPLTILYTLLKFTGIPATEAEALRSRGELYKKYQDRVSMFIPLPPKKGL